MERSNRDRNQENKATFSAGSTFLPFLHGVVTTEHWKGFKSRWLNVNKVSTDGTEEICRAIVHQKALL